MADLTERLAHLAQRFSAEGFVVRDAPFFTESGIAVAMRRHATAEIIQVVEAVVFVYSTPEGWELRVTQHGGPQWVRHAASEREVEGLVRDYLSAPTRPPGPGWREASVHAFASRAALRDLVGVRDRRIGDAGTRDAKVSSAKCTPRREYAKPLVTSSPHERPLPDDRGRGLPR